MMHKAAGTTMHLQETIILSLHHPPQAAPQQAQASNIPEIDINEDEIPFFCKYCESKVDFIDYKDLAQLKFSLSERFKIMPRRLTGNCKRHQELVTIAIKRARQTALIPYIVDRKNVVESPFENVR